MPHPAIVPFYPCRAPFPGHMAVFRKSRKKSVPIVCRCQGNSFFPAVLTVSATFLPS
jgi:hypothetical protein